MKGLTLNLKNLSNRAFYAERDRIVTEMYSEALKENPDVARSQLMQRIAGEVCISWRTVQNCAQRAGMETALPEWKQSGRKPYKDNGEQQA